MAPGIESVVTASRRRTRFGIIGRHPRWSLLFVILLSAGAYWMFGGESGPVTRPLLATVEVGDIENAVTAAGFLQPSEYVDVGAQVSGQLEALHVDVGDIVKAGDLLAEIDATVQFNRVAASRASLQGLEAQLSAKQAALQLAEANARRQTRLMDDDATTESDFDNAMNNLASAQSSLTQLQSQIAQSKAGLASDEAQLGYTKIFAPAAGTVVTINMKVGQTLNNNQQTPIVLRIADLSTMTVEAQVSEADVTKLTPGMEVYFTTLGGGARRWYGTLRQILPTPTVLNSVVLYTALFDADNADKTLFSNMTAQIFFVTSSARNVVKVPVGALTYADNAGRPAGAAQSFAMGTGGVGTGMGGGTGAASGMGGNNTERSIDPAMAERIAERLAQRQAQNVGGGDAPRPTLATVQVAIAGNKFETREVRVGVTSRISAEVISGLEEGEKVVAGVLQARDTSQQQQQRTPNFNFR